VATYNTVLGEIEKIKNEKAVQKTQATTAKPTGEASPISKKEGDTETKKVEDETEDLKKKKRA
jgi:hypothetical protein